MQMQDGQPVLTVFDNRDPKQVGHQLALTVDVNGEPYIQIAKGDVVRMVGFDKLLEVFG